MSIPRSLRHRARRTAGTVLMWGFLLGIVIHWFAHLVYRLVSLVGKLPFVRPVVTRLKRKVRRMDNWLRGLSIKQVYWIAGVLLVGWLAFDAAKLVAMWYGEWRWFTYLELAQRFGYGVIVDHLIREVYRERLLLVPWIHSAYLRYREFRSRTLTWVRSRRWYRSALSLWSRARERYDRSLWAWAGMKAENYHCCLLPRSV